MPESKYIDYLKENPEFEYKGVKQQWVLMSFVSPEGIKNCKVRGLKIHGVLDDYEVAKKKAEDMRLNDPDFHIFIGPVGKWLPWDPDPNDNKTVEDQVFQERELNDLMKGYKDNLEKAKRMEQQRKEDMLKQARDEEFSKKDKQKARMRQKLEAKRNQNRATENSVTTDTPNIEDFKKKEDELNKLEEQAKEQKTKLAEFQEYVSEKERTVESIDDKLNKIQALYNKLQKKQALQTN